MRPVEQREAWRPPRGRMGVSGQMHPVYVGSGAATQMCKLSHPFLPPPEPRTHPGKTPAGGSVVTFDNVAVNGGPELLPGLLVEVLPVDDPHLFEESRLAALASAEQKDLHQPLHVGFLPGETSVDLLGLSQLFHLAAVQQADGQTNF